MALKVFVTAVAIVDDLGAVLVIAAFYTAKLSVAMPGVGAASLAVLALLNLSGVRWTQIWGVALLCGIGFTMSLFIAGLAFGEGELLTAAKVGILAGSLISGTAGALALITARSDGA